jgi:hypothetical protein
LLLEDFCMEVLTGIEPAFSCLQDKRSSQRELQNHVVDSFRVKPRYHSFRGACCSEDFCNLSLDFLHEFISI